MTFDKQSIDHQQLTLTDSHNRTIIADSATLLKIACNGTDLYPKNNAQEVDKYINYIQAQVQRNVDKMLQIKFKGESEEDDDNDEEWDIEQEIFREHVLAGVKEVKKYLIGERITVADLHMYNMVYTGLKIIEEKNFECEWFKTIGAIECVK